MKKYLFLSAMICCLGGCQTYPPKYHLNSTFNEKEAQSLLKNGNNTIKGEAFLRQSGGGIVTCAGSNVMLVPATKYADERMFALYNSNIKGYNGYNGYVIGKNYTFIPDVPAYRELSKLTICDSAGKFEFKNIGDGKFYVIAPVFWSAQGYQGGNLMQKINVDGEKEQKIIMTNN